MVRNKNGNEMGAPDPQVKVSGAVGDASASADKSKEALHENWIEFLKELKESLPDPMTALARAWKFYRDNVDTNVCFNCVGIVGEHNVLAYKINDVFGWVKFYLISGLVVDFNWVSHGKTIAIDFYHLARPEESAY